MFNLWMEEEEEQWHLGKKLLSSCPAEFLCPISLDVMTAPVILVSIPLCIALLCQHWQTGLGTCKTICMRACVVTQCPFVLRRQRQE